MTENDIINTLETDIHIAERLRKSSADVRIAILRNVLNLLYSREAQIEKLYKELTEYKLRLKMSECTVDKIKSEAIKEFVHRLKDRVVQRYEYTDIRIFKEIDNLAKEMEAKLNNV